MKSNIRVRFCWLAVTLSAVAGIVGLTGCDQATSAAEQPSKHVTRITGAQFDAEVTKASSPVVVDFYATWCGPCKKLSPMLDDIAGSFTNRIKFVKVDVDEAQAVAKSFDIEAIPTVIFFRNGKAEDKIVGLPSADELRNRLTAFAKSCDSGASAK